MNKVLPLVALAILTAENNALLPDGVDHFAGDAPCFTFDTEDDDWVSGYAFGSTYGSYAITLVEPVDDYKFAVSIQL